AGITARSIRRWCPGFCSPVGRWRERGPASRTSTPAFSRFSICLPWEGSMDVHFSRVRRAGAAGLLGILLTQAGGSAAQEASPGESEVEKERLDSVRHEIERLR